MISNIHETLVIRRLLFCGFQNALCGSRTVGRTSGAFSQDQLDIDKLSRSETGKELNQTFNAEKKFIIF